MPCALGPRHTAIITVKSPSQDRARSMIIKQFTYRLERLRLARLAPPSDSFIIKIKNTTGHH